MISLFDYGTKYLKTAGAATAAFTIVPGSVLGGKGYPKAKINSDWRQMLEKERSSNLFHYEYRKGWSL